MFIVVLVGSLRKLHLIDFVDFLPLTIFNWVMYIYFWYVLFIKREPSNLDLWHLVS